MSARAILERRWQEHLTECRACREWFEGRPSESRNRCIDGWAISTVFEAELEKVMPAGPGDSERIL